MRFVKWLIKALAIEEILSVKLVNSIVRALLKPISSSLPLRIQRRIPVVGKFSFRLPNGQCLVMEVKGGNVIARTLCWGGIKGFEYETARLFYDLARRSTVVLDVGANIGYYALLAGAVNEKAQVFAFEPVPEIYEALKRNIELNGHSNTVAVPMAVTNFDGDITLYVPKLRTRFSDAPLEASVLMGLKKADEVREIKVPTTTLDSFVSKHAIEKIDLIKIDTEATEHTVLEGARDIIARDAPAIICEVLPGMAEGLLQTFLSDYGYKFYWITDRGFIQEETIQGDERRKHRNYLFCKSNLEDVLDEFDSSSVG